jgi:Na+/serine symporter
VSIWCDYRSLPKKKIHLNIKNIATPLVFFLVVSGLTQEKKKFGQAKKYQRMSKIIQSSIKNIAALLVFFLVVGGLSGADSGKKGKWSSEKISKNVKNHTIKY